MRTRRRGRKIATTLNRNHAMPHEKRAIETRNKARRRSRSLYKANNCCCIAQNLLSLFLVAVVCRALFFLLAS
jgi:hypothetical protein